MPCTHLFHPFELIISTWAAYLGLVKRDANTRTCWQYTFQLTPDHLTPEQSNPLKYSYDVLGEQCLHVLNEICPPEATHNDDKQPGRVDDDAPKHTPAPKRDLYILLRDNFDKHESIQQLWDQANTVPTGTAAPL